MVRISSPAPRILLPSEIGDGRTDTILRVFQLVRRAQQNNKRVELDWQRVKKVTPAGNAILAALFDYCVIQKCTLVNTGIPKDIGKIAAVKNLEVVNSHHAIPNCAFHTFRQADSALEAVNDFVSIRFGSWIEELFAHTISKSVIFSAQLIVNELMVNAHDHSGAGRYYLYAGKIGNDLHVGALDLGVSLPARLATKYAENEDTGLLLSALEQGITTRINRVGGLGLFYVTKHLADCHGRLTILSRNASLRKYFHRRKTEIKILPEQAIGTWCFARLRIV